MPTCSFVNGTDWTGKVKISSTFRCDDPTQPFLQKNMIMETLKEDPATVRKTVFTFNINQKSIVINNLGTSTKGIFFINNNLKMIVSVEGYIEPLGKNGKFIYRFELIPAGFFMILYYLDSNNIYQQFITRRFILQSD